MGKSNSWYLLGGGVNGYYDTARNSEDFWVVYLETGAYKNMVGFMDVHESVVYGLLFLAAFMLLITKIRKGAVPFYYLITAVTFIGGFLFSLIWEGQTGAVIYYPILALPTAIGFLSDFCVGKGKKNSNGSTPDEHDAGVKRYFDP